MLSGKEEGGITPATVKAALPAAAITAADMLQMRYLDFDFDFDFGGKGDV
jgi:hypothetical protein